MRTQFDNVMNDIDADNFESMDVVHHLLSGFKDRQSEEAIAGVDACRRATGGTGFQSNSGFTELADVASPFPTFEGDNTVMVLQASRYIFKLLAWAMKGKKLPYPFGYINRLQELSMIQGKGVTVEEILTIDILFDACAARAALQIKECGQAMQESSATAKVKDNELFSQQKMKMVRAHMSYINFYVYRAEIEKHTFKDSRILPILLDLAKISAIKSLMDDCGSVFDSGYFAPSAWKNMQAALDILVKKIRPQLLPLGEVKAYPDYLIVTNIGNFYGDIYEQQLDQAIDSRMQHEDIGGVPPQWEGYIKPFLHEDIEPKSKL